MEDLTITLKDTYLKLIEDASDKVNTECLNGTNKITIDSLLDLIDELNEKITSLEEEIEDIEKDIEDNYRAIPINEQYEIYDFDFI